MSSVVDAGLGGNGETIKHFLQRFPELIERVRRDFFDKLDPNLCYHSVDHTLVDVLPAAEEFSRLASLPDRDRLILTTAALFHDVGYVDTYENHESSGAQHAQRVLSELGYPEDVVNRITRLIMSTKMPQNPQDDFLCQLMCDADLAALGKPEIQFDRAQKLFQEWTTCTEDRIMSEKAFWIRNAEFVNSHRYWTEIARSLLDPGKAEVIRRNQILLEQFAESSRDD